MMLRMTLALIPCLLALKAASAWSISGTVLDKLNRPIPEPVACLKSDHARCVTGDRNGAFSLSPTVGISAVGSQDPIRVALGNGRISVTAMLPMRLAWEWFDAGGRRLHGGILDLSGGKAAETAMPAAFGEGIYHLRLTGNGLHSVYSVVMLGGAVSVRPSSQPVSGLGAAGLAKPMSSEHDIVVSKPGYRTMTYQVDSEGPVYYETIILTATTDTLDKVITQRDNRILIDRAGGRFFGKTFSGGCDGSTPVVREEYDTSYYRIASGKLWWFFGNSCGGSVMKGSSSDLVGTWDWEQEYANFPPQYRRDGCVPVSDGDDLPRIYDELAGKAKFIFSDTLMISLWEREDCAADHFDFRIETAFAQGSGLRKTESTCRKVAYATGSGASAILAMTTTADSTLADFSFGTATCHAGFSHHRTSYPIWTCPSDMETFEVFRRCLQKTGFAPSAE